MDYVANTTRDRLEYLRQQLETERASFMNHWRELGDYILPRRPRFASNDVNKGDKKNQKIVDSTATFASRTARSGMMSGITSPARRWFRLATRDKDIVEDEEVKAWLYTVTEKMNAIFEKSNLYGSLPIVYGDIITFATSAMMVLEDFENVIHTKHFPIGSYVCSANDRGIVDVFGRTFRMTVRNVVNQFARDGEDYNWENISSMVKEAYESGRFEDWVEIQHFIMPNDMYDPDKEDSASKKFVSIYYEVGSGSTGPGGNYMTGLDSDKILRRMGYDIFPVLVPRWEVNSEDSYGTDCPGMQVLGDIKQLQLQQKRKMQAIEKMVNPSMIGPAHLRNSAVTLQPGGITFVDVRDAANTFRPAHEVRLSIRELMEDMQMTRERIRHGFFENLFLALSTSDRREMTAREVEERHEEKMWALGPVLQRLNQDFLTPLIDLTFEYMLRQGLVPPPPRALLERAGEPLKVEYVSVMAEAQKLVNLKAVERFMQLAGNTAAINPQALDKMDADQLMDVYAELTGIPPGIVRPDEMVEEIRQERAKQQQAQQKMEQLQQAGAMAKDMGSAAQSISQAGGDGAAISEALGGA